MRTRCCDLGRPKVATRPLLTFAGRLAMLVAMAGWTIANAAAAAPPPSLPELQQPANQEHHAGKMIFAELVTPDLAGAKQFYGALFGWTFQDIQFGSTDVAAALLDGHPVAALIGKSMPAGAQRQPEWLTFIATADVDATTSVAVQDGAKVLFAPHDIPSLGREAVFADPQGAVFAVLASSSGDPPDVLADRGAWIWSSLLTTDPDRAAAFYQTVFNYDVFDLPGTEDAQHLILASGNYARASVNPLPTDRPGARPYWLNYIRVDDTVSMAAKVRSLNGRIVLQPQLDRHGGKIAVALDPQGAAFGLMEWTDDMDAGETK